MKVELLKTVVNIGTKGEIPHYEQFQSRLLQNCRMREKVKQTRVQCHQPYLALNNRPTFKKYLNAYFILFCFQNISCKT